MTALPPEIKRANEELRDRLTALKGETPAGELCALEASRPEQYEEWVPMLKRALRTASPIDLGPVFVVTLAELAYRTDWAGGLKFWPEVEKALGSTYWHPLENETHPACTAAFREFATQYAGLVPVGPFAAQYPHISWPLFHAVLPTPAHSRIAKLLATAVADPRFSVTTAGPADERRLATLLVEIASRAEQPLFLQGLLQETRMVGRLCVALLQAKGRTRRATPATPDLFARILRDLERDPDAEEELAAAASEFTVKKGRAAERRAASAPPPPTAEFFLERTSERRYSIVLELERLSEQARDWLRDAAAGSLAGVRVVFHKGAEPLDQAARVGECPLDSLMSSPVTLPIPASQGEREVCISAHVEAPEGHTALAAATALFGPFAVTLRTPGIFSRRGPLDRFSLAPGIRPGADVAVFGWLDQGAAEVLTRIGLHGIDLDDGGRVFVGVPRPPEAPDVSALERKQIGIDRNRLDLFPVLVPPVSSGRSTFEWAASQDGYLQIVGASAPDGVAAKFEGVERSAVPTLVAPEGSLLVKIPATLGEGQLIVTDSGANSSQVFTVRRRPSARVQAGTLESRARVALMPPGATLTHFVSGSCWLNVVAVTGVALTVSVTAGEGASGRTTEEVTIPAEHASPLQTAKALENLRDRLEKRLAPSTTAVAVRVTDEADPSLPLLDVVLRSDAGPYSFDFASSGAAAIVARSSASPPAVTVLRPTAAGFSAQEHEGPEIPVDSEDGVFIAGADGYEVVLVWSGEHRDMPRVNGTTSPRRGVGPALFLTNAIRAVETSTAGPPQRWARATLLREGYLSALRGELAVSLCGHEWITAEKSATQRSGDKTCDVGALLEESLSNLLWVNRSWVSRDLVPLARASDDALDLVARLCKIGVEEDLAPIDSERARHLALLMTRASMAPREDDEACLRWASELALRPRLVRAALLANALAHHGEDS